MNYESEAQRNVLLKHSKMSSTLPHPAALATAKELIWPGKNWYTTTPSRRFGHQSRSSLSRASKRASQDTSAATKELECRKSCCAKVLSHRRTAKLPLGLPRFRSTITG